MLRRTLFYLLILSSLLANTFAEAQWADLAFHLCPRPQQYTGAIKFGNSVVWAGTTALYYSKDTGATWTAVTSFPVIQYPKGISDIAIFDSLHVLVSIINGGVELTTDGGQTWSNVLPIGVPSSVVQVAFNGSASIFHLLEEAPNYALLTTTNAGATWIQNAPWSASQIVSLSFAIAQDRSISVFSVGPAKKGWVNRSSDLGATWGANSNVTDGDCNSIAIDSCDSNKLYLVNENTALKTDNQSRVDVTTDAGVTWHVADSGPLDYFNGSLATTQNVIYTGAAPRTGTILTSGIGVERSTDGGTTWKNIGGPLEAFDTRTITAVNDNIILVLDTGGSVWRTLNSGADSLSLSVPHELFRSDTVTCDSIRRLVTYRPSMCVKRSVIAVTIAGRDSSVFKASLMGSDSVLIQLLPNQNGQLQANLLIVLDDGRTDTVLLSGYGGTPAATFEIRPRSLFLADTTACNPLIRVVKVRQSGCNVPRVTNLKLESPDSLSYRIGPLQGDSVMISFLPQKPGKSQGQLIFQKSDGTFDTVLLGGYVIPNSTRIIHGPVFAHPSLCDPILGSIDEIQTGCYPPTVISISIIGRDAVYFTLGSFNSGVIPISFFSPTAGDFQAWAAIKLSDGSTDTVLLEASARPDSNSFAIAPRVLFARDTALCDPIVRYVTIQRLGCEPPHISSFSLSGLDSSSFVVGPGQGDSISVTLLPSGLGEKHAALTFWRSDGKRDTLILSGFVAPRPNELTVAPHLLFARDTVRCDSIVRVISIVAAGCSPPSLGDVWFVGDSSAYRVSAFHTDSLLVSLRAQGNGVHSAKLVIALMDGVQDTVALEGFVSRDPNAIVLSANTLFKGDTARCDTIVRSLLVRSSGCAPPTVNEITIGGKDSASYQLLAASDTISVLLLPFGTGNVRASLVLHLSDGTVDSIALDGASVNSGGHVTVTPQLLFDHDTVRCDSILRSISYRSTGCNPPTLVSTSIVGPSAKSFVASSWKDDSLAIRFVPMLRGDQQAAAVLTFNDGTSDTVHLAGFNAAEANGLAIQPGKLFESDSISCQDSVVRGVSIAYLGCIPPRVLSPTIIGHDSENYRVLNVRSDSIFISFFTRSVGAHSASLVLPISDGSGDTVRLGGYSVGPVQLRIATLDISTDTLGNVVELPITLLGLAKSTDLEIVMHYEGDLNYLGTFDHANVRVDSDNWWGHSKISLKNATLSGPLAWARFEVFADSAPVSIVTFDSLRILDADAICGYTLPEAVVSRITIPMNCGSQFISTLLRRGQLANFRVVPNPAEDFVRVEGRGLRVEEVQVFDVMGRRVSVPVAEDHPPAPSYSLGSQEGEFNLDVRTLADGVYYLRIGAASTRFVIQR